MKIFRELILILILYFLGEIISKALSIPIPGNIIGMILLFLCLWIGIIKVDKIDNIANFFLDHLAFFFIPAGVGLMNSFGDIKSSAVKILIVCILTTIIVMAVTGRIVQFTANKFSKKNKSNNTFDNEKGA